MAFSLISSLSKRLRMTNATEMKLLRGTLYYCFKITPISLLFILFITIVQHNIATIHTARDIVNFLRANNIAFINDWPAKSPDLNPFGIIWISVLDIALFHCQTSFS